MTAKTNKTFAYYIPILFKSQNQLEQMQKYFPLRKSINPGRHGLDIKRNKIDSKTGSYVPLGDHIKI
ncbi:hypothetical protein BpHYR1_013750 [Brachionus plicatilis]|uniref:Uncharacterized protein n=1 Tax=Brachionus plicatilis TaxID=10195 RepID=A0A3M7PA85_BRAPC|nr:hypothetical protein BpHYR1_013750 [Brachionus plicatilis]